MSVKRELDNTYVDGSDFLANTMGLTLEFYHVPTKASVKFKAFLTQFEDQYASNWNSEKVYGRMDPIATFQGTERTITLGWTVPSKTLLDGRENLFRAGRLISMLYPTYQQKDEISMGANRLNSSPLLKLKFGNLIRMAPPTLDEDPSIMSNAEEAGLLGYCEGFSYIPDLESGFYNVQAGEMIPQSIQLNCTFHVLHQHHLGWKKASSGAPGKPAGGKSDFPYGSPFKSEGARAADPRLRPARVAEARATSAVASSLDEHVLLSEGGVALEDPTDRSAASIVDGARRRVFGMDLDGGPGPGGASGFIEDTGVSLSSDRLSLLGEEPAPTPIFNHELTLDAELPWEISAASGADIGASSILKGGFS